MSPMKKGILHIISLLLPAMLLMAGCSKESVPVVGQGKGKLVVGVVLDGADIGPASGQNAPRSMAAARDYFDNFNNENDKWGIKGENIETLRIIILKGNGEVEHNFKVDADNATLLGQYTFEVTLNDTKTIIFVANEGSYSVDIPNMEISGGIQSLSQLLDTQYAQGETPDLEALQALTIALQHNSADNTLKSLETPLPITAIYTETIPDADDTDVTVTKTYYLHRAAVKYSFRVVNLSSYPHKLEGIKINSITNREFLFPHAVYGSNYEVNSYDTPATASSGEYQATLSAPLQLPANMTQAVEAIPAFYVPEGKAGTEPQKVTIALDGAELFDWQELKWRMPGQTEAQASPMIDLPRNSHVVVNITITDHDITLIADLQPYSVAELDPWFGLDRDNDGNIVIKRYDDGSYEVLVDNERIWRDLDGDQILKQFTDKSLFCKEYVKKDYIHDGNETDYEYPYEKDYSGGNMIIIREQSSGGTYHGTGSGNEDHHDHDNTDRAKFVLAKDNEFYRCDWTRLDDKGHATYSPNDVDGAKIIQCNGYQFRIIGGISDDINITSMQKYIGTYLVEKEGAEELRYYREDYSQPDALRLDIEKGMEDPGFQARYPGVYNIPASRTLRGSGRTDKISMQTAHMHAMRRFAGFLTR